MFADVVIPAVPVSPFTYKIPEILIPWIEIGARVEVPVKGRNFTGVVIDIQSESSIKRVREITVLKDPVRMIPDSMVRLLRWISDYYVCGLPECYQAALPSRFFRLSDSMISEPGKPGSKAKESLPDLISSAVFEPQINDLKRRINEGGLKLIYRRFKIPEEYDRRTYSPENIPNHHQKAVIEKVISDLTEKADSERSAKNYLLYGVTGSGKTLVYMEIANYVIERGRSAIFLVPEISLTPVMEKRFIDAFGKRVGVLHSRLAPAERFKRWEMARRGYFDIVLGPRSAVFVPLKNTGIIIVDEEQDASYKQESPAPRYNARDVAVMRGRIESIPVILGSATPSVESYYNVTAGKYEFLELPERPGGSRLPLINILDMTREKEVESSVSATLIAGINEVLLKNKQALILLNRRGYARYVRCPECGRMWRCPDCDINYTFHTQSKRLICHYCGRTESPPETCPDCGGSSISLYGTGTQRLEVTLNELFPEAVVARMDLDSILSRGKLEQLIEDVSGGKVNILMGTQMVGKGFDFPDIQLTGILSTDLGLSFPDFRARENTFRLLTQAAGRAGRRAEPGQVIIQTFTPDDYCISTAADQDFLGFYNEELRNRRRLCYPPFSRLVLFTTSSTAPETAEKAARLLHGKLERLRSRYEGRVFRILGPAPAPLYKLRKMYRYQVLLKLDSVLKFNKVLKEFYPEAPMGIIPRNARLSMNVDPQEMM
jgi:primosomal protein N' (replication factor Y)